jgi:hypothetical protein
MRCEVSGTGTLPLCKVPYGPEAEFMNILGVLRLEVSVWISQTMEKGAPYGFLRFSSFLLCRNCNKLREFGETEISRQSCRGDCE